MTHEKISDITPSNNEWRVTAGVFALGAVLTGSLYLLGRSADREIPVPASLAQNSAGIGTEDELQARRAGRKQSAEIQPSPQRASLIEQNLKEGRKEAIFGDISGSKKYTVIELAHPVTMEVTTNMGIWIRWFANRIIEGNQVPPYAPGDQPQLKAWYWGQPITEPISEVVLEDDEQKKQAVLFAVTPSGDILYWPVFDSKEPDDPFVNFQRDGKIIPLGRLLTEKGVAFYSPF